MCNNDIIIGGESHQLLEKITSMEQERLTFVTKNEVLNEENKSLWTTVNEMVSIFHLSQLYITYIIIVV